MKTLLTAFAIVSILQLAACGSSDEKPLNDEKLLNIEVWNGKARILSGDRIDCNGTICDGKIQYCLLAFSDENLTSSECLAWPVGDRDCYNILRDSETRAPECDASSYYLSGKSCVSPIGNFVVTCNV